MGEYYGAQFIGQGWSDFNNALGRAFEQREKRKEEAKREAQLTQSLRKTLDLMRPEGKDVRAQMGRAELQGEFNALGMQAAEMERQYRQRESVARTALQEEQLNALLQEQAQGEAAQRFYGELGATAPQEGMMVDPATGAAMPGPGGVGGAGMAWGGQQNFGPDDIFGALRRSGYAPPPNQLDQLIRSLAPARAQNQIPVTEFGQPRPVPGMPGHMYVPTSVGGGQLVATGAGSAAGSGEPQEMTIGGKPSGWALFPDGKYRRLPAEKDELDAAEFDADGDGVINAAEFAQAAMASRLKGDIFPGMRVTKPAAKGGAGVAKKTRDPLSIR